MGEEAREESLGMGNEANRYRSAVRKASGTRKAAGGKRYAQRAATDEC